MKHKKSLTITALALSVVSLTGCGFQTAVESMALSAAMQLPYIVNNVDVKTQELAQFENMPTTKSRQADIKYVQNVLAIPKTIAMEEYGLSVSFEIASEQEANFLIFEEDLEELSGEGSLEGMDGVSLTAFVLIPVGLGDYAFREDSTATSSLLDFVDHMQESFDVMDVVKISEQAEVEVKINVTGKIGNTTKTQPFYFKINETSLDDLASIADTSLEELGVPSEIVEYIEDWPSEPEPEVIEFVEDNWPEEMPAEVEELIGDDWPETLPEEWQTEWPSPEEAADWLDDDENWPDNLSDLDWADLVGILGNMDQSQLPL